MACSTPSPSFMGTSYPGYYLSMIMRIVKDVKEAFERELSPAFLMNR